MGRRSACKSNYDDLKKLTLADLKRYGVMVPMHQYSTTIKWTRPSTGAVTGTIDIAVSLLQTSGWIDLGYTYRDQGIVGYKIDLVQQPSNLGRGLVWYFVCPITGKRCRTLYLAGRYFASRNAVPGIMYESQTYSKHYRWLDKTYGTELKVDNAYEELWKPNVKRHYRGKPTPRLRHLLKLDSLRANRKPLILEGFLTRRK